MSSPDASTVIFPSKSISETSTTIMVPATLESAVQGGIATSPTKETTGPTSISSHATLIGVIVGSIVVVIALSASLGFFFVQRKTAKRFSRQFKRSLTEGKKTGSSSKFIYAENTGNTSPRVLNISAPVLPKSSSSRFSKMSNWPGRSETYNARGQSF